MSNPIHRRSVDRFMAMTDGREEVSVLASEYDALESENEALRSQLTDALNRQTCEGGQPYVCHTLATARSRLAEADKSPARDECKARVPDSASVCLARKAGTDEPLKRCAEYPKCPCGGPEGWK